MIMQNWVDDGHLQRAIRGEQKHFVFYHGSHPSSAEKYINDFSNMTGKRVEHNRNIPIRQVVSNMNNNIIDTFLSPLDTTIYVFHVEDYDELRETDKFLKEDKTLKDSYVFVMTAKPGFTSTPLIDIRPDTVVTAMKALGSHNPNVLKFAVAGNRINTGWEWTMLEHDPKDFPLHLIGNIQDLPDLYMQAHKLGDMNLTWAILGEMGRRGDSGFTVLTRLYEHYRMRMIIMTTPEVTVRDISRSTGYPEWLIRDWNDNLDMTEETCRKLLWLLTGALKHVYAGSLTAMQALYYINMEIDSMGIEILDEDH